MIYALTGGTGMIGLAIVKELIKYDNKVFLFVRENSSKLSLVPNSNKIIIIPCNLNNLEFINVDYKVDYFIHLGWDKTIGIERNDCYLQNMNIKYTLDAIKLASKMKAKKFVGIGSQAEYGIKNEKLSIYTKCDPITGYGIAKYAAGKLGLIYSQQLGMDFNWIRVLSVYGDYDNPNTLISYLLNCIKNNVDANVSPCEQIWDYIDANSAAKLIIKITNKGKNGMTYPLGSGNGRKLKDILEDIKKKNNSNIKINYGARPYNENQVMYLVADMSYLKDLDSDE